MQDISTKQLAIAFKHPGFLEQYYQQLRGIFLQNGAISSKGTILDLNSLPTEPLDFKTAFIKWMLDINAPRILNGEEPIMTLELALKCPIWKVIKPPVKKLSMNQEGMFNKPSVKTMFKQQQPGSINK
jgi:hypothetical protein